MGRHSGICVLVILVVLHQRVAGGPGGNDPLLTYNEICDPVTGLCYQAFSDLRTHVDAWYTCHNLGMHLAMPRTQQEINFIYTNITGGVNHAGFWIGLVDVWTEMVWTWLDMEPANDTLIPWKNHEPKDSKGNDEDCVEIKYDGWNNAQCSHTKPYLCQAYLDGCSTNSTYVYGDKCYRLITGQFLWRSTLCTGLGGTLAMPKTTDVNIYLNNINYEEKEVWIGLIGLPFACDYSWVDRDCLPFSALENFITVPNEPNQVGGVVITTGGMWDGITDPNFETSYVCQIDLVVVDCGNYAIVNGYEITGVTTEGTNRTYTCKTSYVPRNYTTCLTSGQWDPVPACLRDCGNYAIVNGYEITGVTTEGTNRTYTCKTSYVPRNYTTCLASGQWGPVPECLRDCRNYAIVNGYEITGVTTEGTNRTYTCKTSYVPRNYTMCLASGTWDPVPACLRDCGNYAIVNGYEITGVTTEGTNRTYTCKTSYVPRNYTTCLASGMWDPVPACLRECGTYKIQNGDTITGVTTEGTSHSYACLPGFRSISEPITVCMTNGSWTPTPICVHAGCGALNVSNGRTVLEATSVGTNRSVACNIGYAPSNSNWTMCSETGAWEPPPECVVDLTKTCLCLPIMESNLTLEEKVEYYVKLLRVEKETLSSTRRQLTSAADDRSSARWAGFVGAAVLVTAGLAIFTPDALRVLQVAKVWISR